MDRDGLPRGLEATLHGARHSYQAEEARHLRRGVPTRNWGLAGVTGCRSTEPWSQHGTTCGKTLRSSSRRVCASTGADAEKRQRWWSLVSRLASRAVEARTGAGCDWVLHIIVNLALHRHAIAAARVMLRSATAHNQRQALTSSLQCCLESSASAWLVCSIISTSKYHKLSSLSFSLLIHIIMPNDKSIPITIEFRSAL